MPDIDFFISYDKADADWAKWIAWQLNENGYSISLLAINNTGYQAEEISEYKAGYKGQDFSRLEEDFNYRKEKQVLQAISKARHTIIVLSPDYLIHVRKYPTLQAILGSPQISLSSSSTPLPSAFPLIIHVRQDGSPASNEEVEKTTFKLSRDFPYLNLIGLDEAEAREELLERVRDLMDSNLPGEEQLYSHREDALTEAPIFPGTLERNEAAAFENSYRQLKLAYRDALNEARQWVVFSWIVVGLAMLVAIVGIWMMVNRMTNAGILVISISALLYLDATFFFRRARDIHEKVDEFYVERLTQIGDISRALALISSTKIDRKTQDQLREEVASRLLGLTTNEQGKNLQTSVAVGTATMPSHVNNGQAYPHGFGTS